MKIKVSAPFMSESGHTCRTYSIDDKDVVTVAISVLMNEGEAADAEFERLRSAFSDEIGRELSKEELTKAITSGEIV